MTIHHHIYPHSNACVGDTYSLALKKALNKWKKKYAHSSQVFPRPKIPWSPIKHKMCQLINYLINICQSCIRSTDEKKTHSPTSKSQHVSLLPADLDLHSLVG